MIKKLFAVALAFGLSAALIANANAKATPAEDAVRAAVETKVGAKAVSVRASGYLNLYEVFTDDGRIFYTDEKVSAIILGNLIDLKTRKSITEERMLKLTAIKFNELPLDRAIKQVKGDGKRVLASFEDPNCGYCKRLARDLQKLDNVTIYTFLLPILSEDSAKKSRQIWCSADRAKAWNEWMLENKAPEGKDDCDLTALNKNVELATKLKIQATPMIFFASGERVPGAIPLPQIEQKLNQPAQ